MTPPKEQNNALAKDHKEMETGDQVPEEVTYKGILFRRLGDF